MYICSAHVRVSCCHWLPLSTFTFPAESRIKCFFSPEHVGHCEQSDVYNFSAKIIPFKSTREKQGFGVYFIANTDHMTSLRLNR